MKTIRIIEINVNNQKLEFESAVLTDTGQRWFVNCSGAEGTLTQMILSASDDLVVLQLTESSGRVYRGKAIVTNSSTFTGSGAIA